MVVDIKTFLGDQYMALNLGFFNKKILLITKASCAFSYTNY